MAAPTFQVAGVAITRRDQEDGRLRSIRAVRGDSGRWTLELPVHAEADAPVKRGSLEVPANGPKVESLLAALTSLRVAEVPKGYVDDDVKDRSKYGLDSPAITAELLVKTQTGEEPMILHVGKEVPDEPGRVYACRGDQDDVVMIESRALTEVPVDAKASAASRSPTSPRRPSTPSRSTPAATSSSSARTAASGS